MQVMIGGDVELYADKNQCRSVMPSCLDKQVALCRERDYTYLLMLFLSLVVDIQ